MERTDPPKKSIRYFLTKAAQWFFSFGLDPVVPGCPAVRSALLRPETTVAETVEFLRLSGPGQGPRELS
jgi:hypothetical protein